MLINREKKLISFYIYDYAYWIKSYEYWKMRCDERIPDGQGLYLISDILERMNQAAKEAADAKEKLEELLGCEIADLRLD